MDLVALGDGLERIARQAGAAIMDIYQQDFGVYEKQDASPLTDADLAAHNVIVKGLSGLSELPILSEESADIDWQTRQQWDRYWLVDPLDGTKEFIKKNGEFTVNIALIDNGKPVLGVVYAPALDVCYVGIDQHGAFKISEGQRSPITPKAHQQGETWKVVGSRSHQSPEIQALLERLPGDTELVAMGSSLKLCLVAEGAAHLYPRLGPTSEWDTGAAQAVVEAAGGSVTVIDSDDPLREDAAPLRYNQKESVLNPYFLVSC
ncbi:3'(2'),5'-bisphosphate nucleotidase CysQ [Aestuariibacter halophilus]|uniref:3'(2'),5'-bisphosphate nucleotidase CysQ n=1 Tax=Fluctibacter halophilus TaxID=226011 RepID=A0ABS8GCB9_9ALTE|nr:3'(2'),5'-bisphosphate nucleotidase CysQ [Aestuariibacter halophilus]MCC2616846.1 3'(2'),5'-bisphosphate nucleotidase CysQ [Aestuariibacter halophilus]